MADNEDIKKKVSQFVKTHGIACGGNWTQMAMEAIRNGRPDIWASLPDKEYEFGEVMKIIEDQCVS